MTDVLKIYRALFFLAVTGCASVNTSSDVAPLREASPAPVLRPTTQSVQSVVAADADWKRSDCLALLKSIKTHWKKKMAMEAAARCMASRDWPSTRWIGHELSQRETTEPWGPYYLAAVAREDHEWDRASWLVDQALRRMPGASSLHYLRGQILWDTKQFSASLGEFEKATELDPRLWTARLFLGQVYLRDQQPAKAIENFKAALSAHGEHVEALTGLAQAQIETQEISGAIGSLEKLVRLLPDDETQALRLGELLEKAGRTGEALGIYKNLRALKKSKRGIAASTDVALAQKIHELELAMNKSAQSEKGQSRHEN